MCPKESGESVIQVEFLAKKNRGNKKRGVILAAIETFFFEIVKKVNYIFGN